MKHQHLREGQRAQQLGQEEVGRLRSRESQRRKPGATFVLIECFNPAFYALLSVKPAPDALSHVEKEANFCWAEFTCDFMGRVTILRLETLYNSIGSGFDSYH